MSSLKKEKIRSCRPCGVCVYVVTRSYYSVSVSKPVHVSETGQYISCLAKVTVLFVVAPQQVHIVHLTLVLLDHMHQMFLQVWRIHLNRVQIKKDSDQTDDK